MRQQKSSTLLRDVMSTPVEITKSLSIKQIADDKYVEIVTILSKVLQSIRFGNGFYTH